MSQRIFSGAIALAMLFSIGSISPALSAADEAPKSAAASANVDYLPKVQLVDQFGKPFTLSSVKGKPALVGFIHTSCQGACELMTAKMKTVAQDLDPNFASKVTMVSMTTDPSEDGPKQLAKYAKNQGTVGNGWVFLTGKPAEMKRALNLYGVAVSESEDEMTHVFELRLIGSDGHELHRYEGTDVKAAAIAGDIKSALTHN